MVLRTTAFDSEFDGSARFFRLKDSGCEANCSAPGGEFIKLFDEKYDGYNAIVTTAKRTDNADSRNLRVLASSLPGSTVPFRRESRNECLDRVLSAGFRCIPRDAETSRYSHVMPLQG